MWEFPIVILQITIRQDFLISCDTYRSTHKRICQLQVTSRVKGTWRRGNGNIVIGHIVWRGHHGTWSNRKRGTVFLFLFFTTTFTTKLGKNKKKKKKFARCFKNLILMLRTSKRRIHFYTYQGRKTIVWTYSVLNASYAIDTGLWWFLFTVENVFACIRWLHIDVNTKVRMKLHILVINFYEIQKLQFISLGFH